MKLGIIAPVPELDKLPIGDCHLILTSLVLSNQAYADFYRSRSDAGDFIIMDNDAHENKEALPIKDLIKAAEIVKPSEIVLPDVIRDSVATAIRTLRAVHEFKAGFPGTSLMAVIQGSTLYEWRKCLTELSKKAAYIDTIGIPRVFADDFGTWCLAVQMVLDYWPHTGTQTFPVIHLLGSPHNIDSASQVERMWPGKIRSTDTAKPVHYALAGIGMEEVHHSAGHLPGLNPDQRNPLSRPIDFFDITLTQSQRNLAIDNINKMRRAVGDHS